MGGFGSGRWNYTPTRRQADGSFRLRAPPAWMVEEGRGVYIWHRTGQRALNFFVRVVITGAGADLRHPYGQAFVGLESTPSNLGRGSRFWWLCPDCGRRCLKLYLPPRARHFACRVCHDLSYESAQSSRASYYELFKSCAREYGRLDGPQGAYLRSIGIRPLTATHFREHIRAGIGGNTTAPYEGEPRRW